MNHPHHSLLLLRHRLPAMEPYSSSSSSTCASYTDPSSIPPADAGLDVVRFQLLLPQAFSDEDASLLYAAVAPLLQGNKKLKVCVEAASGPYIASAARVFVTGPTTPVRPIHVSSSSREPLVLSPAQEALVCVIDSRGVLHHHEDRETRGTKCLLLIDAAQLDAALGSEVFEAIADAGADLRVIAAGEEGASPSLTNEDVILEISGDVTAVRQAVISLSGCLHGDSEAESSGSSVITACPMFNGTSSQLPETCFEMLCRSDDVIDSKLKDLLINENEDIFYDSWSSKMKSLFYEAGEVKLSKIAKMQPDDVDVADSCIFDTEGDITDVQAEYLIAMSHYLAWQKAGSDGIFQIGDKTIFTTRKNGTFIFWYRYKNKDLGMVIDGQTGWAWGYLTRDVSPDGSYVYGPTIVFQRPNETDKSGNSSQKNQASSDDYGDWYIVTDNKIVVDTDGQSSSSPCNLYLSLEGIQAGIRIISSHTKDKSFKDRCHAYNDMLVLFGPEAARNSVVLHYTFQSLDADSGIIAIPKWLHETIVKHDKVSQSTIESIRGLLLEEDDPGNNKNRTDFKRISGAPFRKLAHVLDVYCFLKRKNSYRTNFFLSDRASSYRAQKKDKVKSLRHEQREELEERKRVAEVATRVNRFLYLHHHQKESIGTIVENRNTKGTVPRCL